jgi:hypothetical protein
MESSFQLMCQPAFVFDDMLANHPLSEALATLRVCLIRRQTSFKEYTTLFTQQAARGRESRL